MLVPVGVWGCVSSSPPSRSSSPSSLPSSAKLVSEMRITSSTAGLLSFEGAIDGAGVEGFGLVDEGGGVGVAGLEGSVLVGGGVV